MSINELANKDRRFYETNYNKIIKFISKLDNKRIFKYDKNEIFDLGEIISKIIFLRIVDNYREDLNLNYVEHIDFTPTLFPYDVVSNRNMYELKIRRPSFNPSIIRYDGGLLKKSKFEFMMGKTLQYNFFYINICNDRVFIWNLNAFSANINFDYSINKFHYTSARNISNNGKIPFIKLDYKYCKEIVYTQDLIDELNPIFKFLEEVEDIKVKKNISI